MRHPVAFAPFPWSRDYVLERGGWEDACSAALLCRRSLYWITLSPSKSAHLASTNVLAETWTITEEGSYADGAARTGARNGSYRKMALRIWEIRLCSSWYLGKINKHKWSWPCVEQINRWYIGVKKCMLREVKRCRKRLMVICGEWY